jgi:hypothetical protein
MGKMSSRRECGRHYDLWLIVQRTRSERRGGHAKSFQVLIKSDLPNNRA